MPKRGHLLPKRCPVKHSKSTHQWFLTPNYRQALPSAIQVAVRKRLVFAMAYRAELLNARPLGELAKRFFDNQQSRGRNLRERLERCLVTLNYDEIAQMYREQDYSPLPSLTVSEQGALFTFTAMPKGPERRGQPGVRPVGIVAPACCATPWRSPRSTEVTIISGRCGSSA